VGDGSSALPQVRTRGLQEVGGRGLALVESLSSGWGVTPTLAGKRVWFEVSAPAPVPVGDL
jgi:hypothetical protein